MNVCVPVCIWGFSSTQFEKQAITDPKNMKASNEDWDGWNK